MLAIDVGNEHLEGKNIAPGTALELHYTIGPEADYQVKIVFASGRVLEERVGYVDAGYTSHDYLVVYSDRIADETGPGGMPASAR